MVLLYSPETRECPVWSYIVKRYIDAQRGPSVVLHYADRVLKTAHNITAENMAPLRVGHN